MICERARAAAPALSDASAIREKIRKQTLSPGELRAALEAKGGRTFISLDFVRDVFGTELGSGTVQGDDGTSFGYVPSNPVSVIRGLDRVDLTPAKVFYDIGCGGGIPLMLAHYLTGARAIGVERNKDTFAAVNQTVRALENPSISVVNADALKLDYSDADVFYMYTPFYGRPLKRFLEGNIRPVARAKPIAVIFVGPAIGELRSKKWLVEDADGSRDFGIFRSNPQKAAGGAILASLRFPRKLQRIQA